MGQPAEMTNETLQSVQSSQCRIEPKPQRILRVAAVAADGNDNRRSQLQWPTLILSAHILKLYSRCLSFSTSTTTTALSVLADNCRRNVSQIFVHTWAHEPQRKRTSQWVPVCITKTCATNWLKRCWYFVSFFSFWFLFFVSVRVGKTWVENYFANHLHFSVRMATHNRRWYKKRKMKNNKSYQTLEPICRRRQ